MSSNLADLVGDVVENAARGAAEGMAEEMDATERAYEDRNVLALAFVVDRARMGCDAGWYDDETNEDWPVVWATLGTGQVSWHLPPKFRDHLEVSDLVDQEPVGGYDGHDRHLKNARVERHAMDETADRLTRDALPPA